MRIILLGQGHELLLCVVNITLHGQALLLCEVSITLLGQALHLCVVSFIHKCFPLGENLSLEQPSLQSGTLLNYVASMAVDGGLSIKLTPHTLLNY